MKYLKRLKNELADLSLKLRGRVFQTIPTRMGNRARALQSLVVMIQEVRNIDQATDDWSEGNAQDWFFYLAELEKWLSSAPKVPEKVTEEELRKALTE